MGGRVKDVRHTWGTREYGIWDMGYGVWNNREFGVLFGIIEERQR
jgi:hypothetical protein